MDVNLYNKSYKISVVIASLGGEILIKTLNLLNNNSLKPDEIIIIIPNEYKENIPLISFSNVRYELVSFKGQVAQSAHGFKLVKNEYFLQLDDDIQLDKNCLETLLNSLLSLGNGHSVGPAILYNDSNTSVYSRLTGISKILLNLKSYFLSGAPWGSKRMGKIIKSGAAFGYDNKSTTENFIQSEWLAGGCVLHFKSGLIFDNYFPFKGKAYGEDLIHSWLLINSGVKLYVVSNAICCIDKPVINSENYSIFSDYKSRLYLNELRGLSKSRVHFWYLVRSISYFVKSLIP